MRELVEDWDTELVFSAASIREVAIKNRLGHRDFRVDPRLLRRGLLESGYIEMAVTGEHAASVDILPHTHKDTFDRILITQALIEGITLVTADAVAARYAGPIRTVRRCSFEPRPCHALTTPDLS